MELIAIVIGIIVLGLAAVDELQRDWDQKRLSEELHEQSEVHSTPVMNCAEVEDCDDPVKEGIASGSIRLAGRLSPVGP